MDKEKTIKKIIKEFFEKITLEEEPENIKIKDGVVSFEIKTEIPEILIGQRGQILIDIQHLLSRIISKKIDEKIFIDFDINQYKKKKTDYLEGLAKNIADEVALTKKEMPLPFMNSFERKIVHLAIGGREDVVAESQGEEPERRIVIKPKTLITGN